MSEMTIHTECFDNVSIDNQLDQFEQIKRERIDAMYRVYFGWVPLPIAIIAIPFATVFVIGACRAIITRQASRKFYLLLVNRTIADILYCISALVTSFYVLRVEHVNDIVIAIIENLASGGAWSVMVSCVSLSVLKLYAIWKPFSYRKTVTLKRCIYLIVLSWTIFVIVVAHSLVTMALIQVPKLREWSGCNFELCFRRMGHSRYIVVLTVYFATLIILVITGKNRLSNDGRPRFPIWKVMLNVGTFAIVASLYVSWCIFLLSHRDGCFFLRNFFVVMRLFGIIRCTMLLRVLIDPILSFLAGHQKWSSADGYQMAEATRTGENLHGKRNLFLESAQIMNDITSPIDSDTCSSIVDTNTLSVNTTAPKKKGGRPRKEDAAQKEQELSSEAKAKRDKRRHDNLLAAARYRQKKDEAIKVLTQQLQARELEVNEKYAKIMEFKNRIEQMESFRQDFSEQLAELKTKWDSELSAVVDAAQVQQTTRTANATMSMPTTPARGVLIMPITRNISTSQTHTYALSSNTIDASLNEATDISSSGMRSPQAIRQIGIASTTISPSSPRIMGPSSMKRLPKHLPAEYLQAAIHRGIEAQRQPTPPMIDGFARSVVAVPLLRETVHPSVGRSAPHVVEQASSQRQMAAKLGDMQPPMGQLRLPIVRSNSPVSNNASADDGVLSFLRLDQPNPYSAQDHVATSPSSTKEQARIRTFAHRKGRPRLDETHSGQVLTATNCELEKYSPTIMRYQQPTNLVPSETLLALRPVQRCEGSRGVMQQNAIGKPMRSTFSNVINH